MNRDAEIFTALLTRYAAFTATPQPLIAYPGVHFEEPGVGDAQIWLEAQMFPAEPQRVSYAGEVADYRGYFQVTVCQRRGFGMLNVSRMASKVADHFAEASRLFTSSDEAVIIYRPPGVSGAFESEGQVRQPVAIYYQAIA